MMKQQQQRRRLRLPMCTLPAIVFMLWCSLVTAATPPPRLAFVHHSQDRTSTTTTTHTRCPSRSFILRRTPTCLTYRQRNDNNMNPDGNYPSPSPPNSTSTGNNKESSWSLPSSVTTTTTTTTTTTSPTSSPSGVTTTIQRLDIPDRLLSDIFDVAPIQHWLYHTLPSVQTSDVCWLHTSHAGDVLTISPLALISELFTSLTTTATSAATATFSSLQHRTRFRFEHQRCLLRAISHDPLALTDLLQHGQSNTHPLGYSLVALPPHSRLPLAILPSLSCSTVLTGNLCIQQVTPPPPPSPSPLLPSSSLLPPPQQQQQSQLQDYYWDPDSLCRQTHHCVGTPLSNLSSPPTEHDLILVAQDVQQRVDDITAASAAAVDATTTTTTTIVQQQQPTQQSPHLLQTERGTPPNRSIKLQNRHYASAGSFVAWQTGTIVSVSTHEQPCLLLCLSANLPTIHYKPLPPTWSSSSTTNSKIMSKLFPK